VTVSHHVLGEWGMKRRGCFRNCGARSEDVARNWPSDAHFRGIFGWRMRHDGRMTVGNVAGPQGVGGASVCLIIPMQAATRIRPAWVAVTTFSQPPAVVTTQSPRTGYGSEVGDAWVAYRVSENAIKRDPGRLLQSRGSRPAPFTTEASMPT
jgi:hypothetical protein